LKGFGQNNHDKKIYKKSFYSLTEENIDYAIKLHLKGNISEAIKYYKYFIDNGNKDARVFCNYGLILQNLGDLEKAQQMMENAIHVNPDDIFAHNNLAGILQELGKYDSAEEILNKTLELDPKNSIT